MKYKNTILVVVGAALAALATIFLVRKKQEMAGERPPRKAPQLRNVENPGDQSEFLTSPSDSEIG
jgi:LPXTG-motif cell wall-anchored protein